MNIKSILVPVGELRNGVGGAHAGEKADHQVVAHPVYGRFLLQDHPGRRQHRKTIQEDIRCLKKGERQGGGGGEERRRRKKKKEEERRGKKKEEEEKKKKKKERKKKKETMIRIKTKQQKTRRRRK